MTQTEQNFAAPLLKFKRREGHCCVPTFHREGDLKLGYWVATQRRSKKQMSVARRARLNKLKFVWYVFSQRPLSILTRAALPSR
jgi:Helicase associated domain